MDEGAAAWAEKANDVGPTIVGASEKSGGQGFSSRFQFAAWERLGIDPRAIADEPPDSSTPADAMPGLTLQMGARLQGFPDTWQFEGPKGERRRQIANAFPPIVAAAWGLAVKQVLEGGGVVGEPNEAQIKQRTARFKDDLIQVCAPKRKTGGWSRGDLREHAFKWSVPLGNVLPDEEEVAIVEFWKEKPKAEVPKVDAISEDAEIEKSVVPV